jgi:EAL domain-containing protein (putative c-di-GMP-specific phosphodiesterase class I)
VNVSGRQLDDARFPDLVLAALHDAGLPGRALILEVTESTMMTTSSRSIDQLRSLRGQEIRIAIDDFGTGFSSLASVATLPIDIIKIDKSFVQQEEADAGDPAWGMVRAIVAMVEPLHLQTLAEGVETVEQDNALRELDCQLAQGFLVARPMPAQQLGDLLSRTQTVENLRS